MSSGLAAAFRSKRFEHSPITSPGFKGDPVENMFPGTYWTRNPSSEPEKRFEHSPITSTTLSDRQQVYVSSMNEAGAMHRGS